MQHISTWLSVYITAVLRYIWSFVTHKQTLTHGQHNTTTVQQNHWMKDAIVSVLNNSGLPIYSIHYIRVKPKPHLSSQFWNKDHQISCVNVTRKSQSNTQSARRVNILMNEWENSSCVETKWLSQCWGADYSRVNS